MNDIKISNSLRIKELCFSIEIGLLRNEEKETYSKLKDIYISSNLEEKKLIADSLQKIHIPSRDLINLILYDSAEISKNFIINSPCLDDDKLISFIDDNHDLIKLRYIAERKRLNDKTKNSLLKFRDKTIERLLNNNSLSTSNFENFLIKDKSLDKMNSLSNKHFELSIFKLDLKELISSTQFHKIKENLDLITSKTKPNYTFLIRYLCKGLPLSFLYLLSKKSDTSFSVLAEIFLLEQNKSKIHSILKKANVPSKFAIVVVRLFDIILEGSKNGKITPQNLRLYLLKKIKHIDQIDILREIEYIEKII